MSARAPRPSPSTIPSPAPAPQQLSQSPTSAMGGKPKGKDFSAMASRMGTTQQRMPTPQQQLPPQQQQPQQHQMTPQSEAAQQARAAQMQAAARAAAGLPPLERPTATSVTTIPPPVQMSTQAQQRRISGGYPPQQQQQQQMPMQQTMPSQYGGYQQQPPQQQQATSYAPAGGRRPSAGNMPPQARGGSITMAPQHSQPVARRPSVPKATRENTKATSTPSTSESRVAWQGTGAHVAPLVGQRLQELVKQLDPNYTIDPQAEEQVLQLADDFLDKVCKQALRLAQHRGSKTMDVADVQFVLAKQWNIVIPGLGPPQAKKPKSVAPAAASRQTSTASSAASSAQKRKSSATASSLPAAKLTKTNSGAPLAAGTSSSGGP